MNAVEVWLDSRSNWELWETEMKDEPEQCETPEGE